MCGRFALWAEPDELVEHFRLPEPLPFQPRYNIAPSQDILAVGHDPRGQPKPAVLHWGLIPHLAEERTLGPKLINARAESLWSKPLFKAAAKHRRCLIPASCFFEWQRRGKGPKQPYCIRPQEGGLFAFAAIWEHWENPKAEEAIDSCAIVTTRANEAVQALHDRMPVIVRPPDYDLWLNRSVEESTGLQQLLEPWPSDSLRIYAVSTAVNKPSNDSEAVIKPL